MEERTEGLKEKGEKKKAIGKRWSCALLSEPAPSVRRNAKNEKEDAQETVGGYQRGCKAEASLLTRTDRYLRRKKVFGFFFYTCSVLEKPRGGRLTPSIGFRGTRWRRSLGDSAWGNTRKLPRASTRRKISPKMSQSHGNARGRHPLRLTSYSAVRHNKNFRS